MSQEATVLSRRLRPGGYVKVRAPDGDVVTVSADGALVYEGTELIKWVITISGAWIEEGEIWISMARFTIPADTAFGTELPVKLPYKDGQLELKVRVGEWYAFWYGCTYIICVEPYVDKPIYVRFYYLPGDLLDALVAKQDAEMAVQA